MAIPVLLDTDPGIDDAMAILLAMASPEVELRAVTVTGGNCSLEQGVRNGLSVLSLAQAEHVPLAAGVQLPLIRPPFTAPETHGDTGLGYARLPESPAAAVSEHGVDLLIREIMARPGEVTLVAVAPLTNVAIALRKEPRIAQAVREVIIMGGALRADGNTTPLAEFNVYVDPHAAHMVFHSGMPITLIPWDITKEVQLTQNDVDRLLQIPAPIPRFIAEATRFYIEFHKEYFGFAACSINDPAALALAFMPDLARTRPIYIDVEINSETTIGKTVGDFLGMRGKAPNIKLVEEFDNERFISLFLERMETLTRRLYT
jgi:purine nucleosidase